MSKDQEDLAEGGGVPQLERAGRGVARGKVRR